MRTKNIIKNSIIEIVSGLILVLTIFIKTKFFLTYIGDEIYAIYQLFVVIAVYLSIADLGLQGVITASLYKPLAKKDLLVLKRMFNGIKIFFKYVSYIVLALGIVLSFFIYIFIDITNFSINYLQLLFIIYIITESINYCIFPYSLIFDSDQKKYKYFGYFQFINFIIYIIEIITIIVFKNFTIFILISLIQSILKFIIIKFLFKKEYFSTPKDKTKDISFIKQIKNILPHKIAYLITYNLDIVLIARFLPLNHLVRYSLYMIIINQLYRFITSITTSVLPSIGNLLVEEKSKVFKVFIEYNSFLFFLAISLCPPLYISINYFIKLWYGKEYASSNFVSLLFVLVFFYNIIRFSLTTFAQTKGLYKETIINVIFEIVLKISLSILLIKPYGIGGVLLATLISFIVSEYLIKPSILNKHLFNNKINTYYIDNFLYIIIFIFQLFVLKTICSFFTINNILIWFLVMLGLFIINLIMIYFEFKLIKKDYFYYRIKWFDKYK